METRTSSPAASAADVERRSQWALALLLLAVVGVATSLLVLFRDPAAGGGASSNSPAHWTPAPAPDGPTAGLTIDFGNGARREFDALPWREGMTVGDLLRQAQRFRPSLAFTHQGAGAKAFLTSLEGVANDAGAGRYWLYEIDGRSGDVSFEVAPLAAGQRVLWRFGRAE
jgi:hypothetical protein